LPPSPHALGKPIGEPLQISGETWERADRLRIAIGADSGMDLSRSDVNAGGIASQYGRRHRAGGFGAFSFGHSSSSTASSSCDGGGPVVRNPVDS
jgi:hypothetical protein